MAAAPPDLPLLVKEGLEVVPVPPALRGPRSYVVRACSGEGATRRLSLGGVEDIGAAAKLVGKTLLAREADLAAELALGDRRAALGLEVVDERYGELGHVEEVVAGDYQDLWVVRGPRGELLVPVVADLIEVRGRCAHTRLPDGLVG